MKLDKTESLLWLDSEPEFNVIATLVLRPSIVYPSGRTVHGSYDLYCTLYDDFIKNISEKLLGASYAYGQPMYIPNKVKFTNGTGRCHEPTFDVYLALPQFMPLSAEIRLVGDIWGACEWSDGMTEIYSEHYYYELAEAGL